MNNIFILECDSNISYIKDMIKDLETMSNDIMSFFGLEKIHSKIKIVIYNNLKKYQKHIEKYTEYQDYMCADTFDGKINILSLAEAHKTKEHQNMTIDDWKNTILHEFVHICQQECELEHLNKDVVWLWEALATNLGNPQMFQKIIIMASNEEINNFNSLSQNYSIAYTIGKYMLDNYNHEDILKYIKYPSKLLKDSDKILNEARKWSIEKNIKM